MKERQADNFLITNSQMRQSQDESGSESETISIRLTQYTLIVFLITYNLNVITYNFKLTNYNLKVITFYSFKVITYNLKVITYNFKVLTYSSKVISFYSINSSYLYP